MHLLGELRAAGFNALDNLVICPRICHAEAQVFQLKLQLPHPQPAGEGRIELHGFLRHLLPLLQRQGVQVARPVQVVSHLYQQGAQVIPGRLEHALQGARRRRSGDHLRGWDTGWGRSNSSLRIAVNCLDSGRVNLPVLMARARGARINLRAARSRSARER